MRSLRKSVLAACGPCLLATSLIGAPNAAAVLIGPRTVPHQAAVPSKFVRAADAVCSSYRHQVRGLGTDSGLTAQENVAPTLIADANAAVSKLRAIRAPSSAASTFSTFTGQTANAINEFQLAQTRTSSTTPSVQQSVEQQDFQHFANAINDAKAAAAAAHRLKFRVCGSQGSQWL